MRRDQNFQIYRKYIGQMSQVYAQREDIRVFIELLMTLLALFVFIVFAIRPTLKTIGGLTQEISSKKETLQTMDQKIESIQLAQQNFSDNSAQLPLLLQAVPETPEVPSFVSQIEQLAQQSSVTIFSFTISQVAIKGGELKESGEKSIGYSVTFQGSFQSLLTMQTAIENMRRGSKFSTSFLTIDDTSGSTNLLLTLTGEIPYYVVTANE